MKNPVAHRLAATVSAAVVLMVLSACSTTKVTDTWTAPEITRINFKKVLIIGATSNPANRIAAEDATVAALTGVSATASHMLYPNASDLSDMGKLSRAMTDANMDGVVVMQLISDTMVTPPQKEQSLDPTTNVGGYSGYSDFYGTYSAKDSFGAGSHALAETERVVKIESRLYELPSGKLVWTGTTETTSPTSVNQLMGDIVKVLRKKMVEDKLIPGPGELTILSPTPPPHLKNILALRTAAAGMAAAVFLLTSACTGGTKLKDSWTAPDVTKLNFKNVLVIAATSDATTRRTFEDRVVVAAPNTHAVPSYQYFGDKVDITDPAKVTAAVAASSFDAVVVMRLVSDQAETTVNTTTMPTGAYGGTMGMMTPGPGGSYGYGGYGYGAYAPVGYRSFGGYYGDYGMTSTTVSTEHILSVETNIYELPGQKLVWSGLTASTSPGNVTQMAEDVVSAIRQQLIKQKLIATPAK